MDNDPQLERILAHAMPGARLAASRPLGARTLLLSPREGRPVVLRLPAPTDPWAGDPLAAEAAALSALRAEIDLPLPELLAYDAGATAGTPYLLTSYLEGTPLPAVAAALAESRAYDLGMALGALLARVHGYAAPAYGLLDPSAPPQLGREPAPLDEDAGGPLLAASADARYLHARIAGDIAAAAAAGELDPPGAAQLGDWLEESLAGIGRAACLVHGDLRPERLLLRRRESGWTIAGLTGWGFAQAWRPGWDHVGIVEHFNDGPYFGLRVGYGNAYEATTERRYDQLREFALLPFRVALFLESGRADLALNLVRQPDEDAL